MDSDDSDILWNSLRNRKRDKREISLKKYAAKRKRCYEDKENIAKRRHLIDLSTSSSNVEESSSSSTSSDTAASRSVLDVDYPSMNETKDASSSKENSCDSDSSSSISSNYSKINVSNRKVSSLWDDLRRDALETNMSEMQVNCILKTLRHHNVGPLPLDRRTLMRTSNDFAHEVKQLSGMEYYYFGFEKQVVATLSRYPPDALNGVETLIIKDNVDGLPLYKSSSTCFWPLLAKIDNLKPSVVFPVLLTVGKSKPEDLEFLEEAVSEMNSLEVNGIVFNGKLFKIAFVAHICDTPARNMIKACVHFNAYHGCDFCMQRGHYDGKRMTWPVTKEMRIRTDQGFRDREQPDHHKDHRSPYEKTTADMILSFPIDFMHLGGGVMRKLMKWNLFPVDNTRRRCRMSSTNVKILNSRLDALRSCIPNCFARKPRTTKDLQRYKATELRQLLLYTSCLVFKGLMASTEQYLNLCYLSVGCCLLVDRRTARTKNEIAAELLERFCEGAKEIYGASFLVYNVHSLLHLPRVAMTHGSIDSVSAYAFESYLGQLKRSVRSARHPIISAVKAVFERQDAARSSELKILKPKISEKYPNNCYVDIDRKKCYDVIKVTDSSVQLREYSTRPFFNHPVSSNLIGCYKIKNERYIYVHLRSDEVLAMRRGMKIDLARISGLDVRNESVCCAMLHEDEVP